MTSLRDIYTDLASTLGDIDGLSPDRIYLGPAPDHIPEDGAGRVLPFVVIWPTTPTPVDDPMVSGLMTRDAMVHSFQTTCAAADILTQLLPMVDAVCEALTDHPVGAGLIRPDLDDRFSQQILPDPDISPPRFFVPIRWHLTTQ